ncbi:S-adenosyl-L-methionine-dependent methyltransferase [Dentipellis sp. KUC8613]|nr:S-adenosyl-L-methionine-dependent methyltransferase [Dentipellis sp. KUC8613]
MPIIARSTEVLDLDGDMDAMRPPAAAENADAQDGGHQADGSSPDPGTLTDANKQHFSDIAETYGALPSAQKLARHLAGAVRALYALDKSATAVLDFGCGPGLVSSELAGDVKTIVGVDISDGMVEQYDKRAQKLGIPREQMHAVCLELKGEPGELDGATFDLVVCSMAYHHIDDIAATTRTLAGFLKPRGHLIICDMTRPEEGEAREIVPEPFHEIVSHEYGFSEADIRANFAGAGLADFGFHLLVKARVHGSVVDLFVARGVKPAE